MANAITTVEELCAARGTRADYKLMSLDGAVQFKRNLFIYRVQVNKIVAAAIGQTKKTAKHAAAIAIRKKLLSGDGCDKKGFVSGGETVNVESLNDIISFMESIQSSLQEIGTAMGTMHIGKSKRSKQKRSIELFRSSLQMQTDMDPIGIGRSVRSNLMKPSDQSDRPSSFEGGEGYDSINEAELDGSEKKFIRLPQIKT